MNRETVSIEINTNKQILSSKMKIFKTESFFSQTKKISSIDKFILKVAEGIALNGQLIEDFCRQNNCFNFRVETLDKKFSFIVKLRITGNLNDEEKHIVFVDFVNNFGKIKTNDQSAVLFLKNNKIFNCLVQIENLEDENFNLQKLYYVSDNDYVNFPMLSEKQQALVNIENKNVLVQGVAGSGKTNICISKIIFAACKGYTGKVLYTTFSRGLLIDTKSKLEIFKNSVKNFIEDYKNGRIIFLDKNRKRAIENRLGIFIVSDSEQNIIKKLEQITDFLDSNVDYYLFEDLYKTVFDEDFEMSNEKIFINNFLPNLKNHQLKNRLEKQKNLALSLCYKEIYGLIFGSYLGENLQMLSLEEYKEKRKNSFEKQEIEVIYELAKEYLNFQKTQNYLDNNIISYKLLKNIHKIHKYSLSVIDEVQDFTEVNLKLLSEISIKMLAVGDALQMINPTYFSFASLKRLMFKEDLTEVAELECNYRNNKKIVEILDSLGEINVKAFGTHSFVLSSESMDSGTLSNSIYVSSNEFLNKLANQKFENFTVIVASPEEKEKFRNIFKRQEILTVSEIKGLERDTVLLLNLLSSNFDKWQKLERFNVSHKEADENSVFRYYYNLFYVGLSRAKHNIFVFEQNNISMFAEFFKNNFDCLPANEAYEKFTHIISKIEIDDEEIWQRINEFIKLGQFDNARTYVSRFENSKFAYQAQEKIDIYENFVFKNRPREAGINFWKAGLIDEAKQQFTVSGDTKLIEFLESLESRNSANLDVDIVRFFSDFEDNQDAQKLIVDTVKQDLENVKRLHNETKSLLKKFKERK